MLKQPRLTQRTPDTRRERSSKNGFVDTRWHTPRCNRSGGGCKRKDIVTINAPHSDLASKEASHSQTRTRGHTKLSNFRFSQKRIPEFTSMYEVDSGLHRIAHDKPADSTAAGGVNGRKQGDDVRGTRRCRRRLRARRRAGVKAEK